LLEQPDHESSYRRLPEYHSGYKRFDLEFGFDRTLIPTSNNIKLVWIKYTI